MLQINDKLRVEKDISFTSGNWKAYLKQLLTISKQPKIEGVLFQTKDLEELIKYIEGLK